MDRQEMRLVFERGDVTLFDWVPTRVRIHAIADEAGTCALCELFPEPRLDVTASYGGKDRACQGRHKTLDVYQMLELSWGDGTIKSHRYDELLRAVMTDQLAWIARSFPPAADHRGKWPGFAGGRLRGRSAGPGLIAFGIAEKGVDHDPETTVRALAAESGRSRAVECDDFEVVGAFNPGRSTVGNEVILLVRVAERPRERRPGFTASPRWVPGEGLTIDWLPDEQIDVIDPRVVKRKADGLVRLTFISHLR